MKEKLLVEMNKIAIIWEEEAQHMFKGKCRNSCCSCRTMKTAVVWRDLTKQCLEKEKISYYMEKYRKFAVIWQQ